MSGLVITQSNGCRDGGGGVGVLGLGLGLGGVTIPQCSE